MRLTARISPYRDAIAAARQRGLTWPDIGQALGVQPDPLRRAYLHGKRYETGQVPLPEPGKAKITETEKGSAAAVVQARIARPLPGQEKTPEQNAQVLRDMGIEVDE